MDQMPLIPSRQEERGAPAAADGVDVVGVSTGNSDVSGGGPSLPPQRSFPAVAQSGVVRRPERPGENDPKVRRSNEIKQLKTRYGSCFEQDGPTTFKITLKQGDDFPFELEELRLTLLVPEEYPLEGFQPSIRVHNDDIPRGHQINVENGFAKSVEISSRSTRLLDLLNSLDNKLELYLGAEKASTIKIIPNIRNPALDVPQSSSSGFGIPIAEVETAPEAIEFAKPAPVHVPEIEPQFSSPERSAAKSKREADVRQLEARFRQAHGFQKITDGIYVVPLQIRKKPQLPMAFQAVHSARLVIPVLYPLKPCRIELLNASNRGLADTVAKNFETRAQEHQALSLMSHLNYLCLNISTLSQDDGDIPAKVAEYKSKVVQNVAQPESATGDSSLASAMGSLQVSEGPYADRPHISVVPRPRPEGPAQGPAASQDDKDEDYEMVDSDDDFSDFEPELGPEVFISDDEDDVDEEHGDEEHADGEEAGGAVSSAQAVEERGTSISFPGLILKGVEILEISLLNITIKCNRCKATGDITALKPKEASGPQTKTRLLGCDKCSNILGIEFRKELIHEHNTRGGFLDLAGCSITDVLPSDYIPTCAACSTTATAPITGLTRAQTIQTNCRSCFAKMSVFIPDIKLLKISPDALQLDSNVRVGRKATEKLGLVSGTPLPKNGACSHYRRKTRWFRFSWYDEPIKHIVLKSLAFRCWGRTRKFVSNPLGILHYHININNNSCNRVFSCEKCHDAGVPETSKHPYEHANKMICGMCSREQHFKQECKFCGHSFLPRRTGFWEGGKGIRDQVRMSRKDPRKYKRLGN